MKNKKLGIVLGVIALVLVAALFVGIYLATRPETSQGSKEITVIVEHGNGETKNFVYHTDEEFLGPVLTENGLVEGEMGQYGLYIKWVDGERAVYEEDGAYWSLYIGQEPAMTGADTTPIQDGDLFKLVYTLA